MIHPIVTMPDGTEIYVDLIAPGASQDIARRPQLLELVKEALEGKKLSGPEVSIEHDMGQVVGYDFIVATKEDDNIFYAKILRDTAYTRFVKNGQPLPTRYVAIVLSRTAEGEAYELRSARIGRLVPPRPGTPKETGESKLFWAQHAYVQDGEVLQVRTISRESPSV